MTDSFEDARAAQARSNAVSDAQLTDYLLSDAYLQTAYQRVDEAIAADAIEPDRRDFFAAFHRLQAGDVDGAIEGFRRAARSTSTPFEALSMVSLGECERIRGREAAAIRAWKKIAASPSAPTPARSVAWRSLAALAEQRQDPRLAAQAAAGLKKLNKPGDPGQFRS